MPAKASDWTLNVEEYATRIAQIPIWLRAVTFARQLRWPRRAGRPPPPGQSAASAGFVLFVPPISWEMPLTGHAPTQFARIRRDGGEHYDPQAVLALGKWRKGPKWRNREYRRPLGLKSGLAARSGAMKPPTQPCGGLGCPARGSDFDR